MVIPIVTTLLLAGFLIGPALAQEKGWKQEWNAILKAAKSEGKVGPEATVRGQEKAFESMIRSLRSAAPAPGSG